MAPYEFVPVTFQTVQQPANSAAKTPKKREIPCSKVSVRGRQKFVRRQRRGRNVTCRVEDRGDFKHRQQKKVYAKKLYSFHRDYREKKKKEPFLSVCY